MPSAAFSHTTISQPSLFNAFESSLLPGRTTATTRSTSSFRCRADCTAIDTPCGSAWRSLPPATDRRCSGLLDFAGGRLEAPLGLSRPARLLHAVAHRGHLGEDRHRDLRWGLRADVEADRAAQARDLVGGDVELL